MRRLVTTLALAAMIPAVGCDRSPVAPEVEELDVGGVYTLETINGGPLPFLLAASGEDRVEVSGGSLNFNANGRFIDLLNLRFTENGAVDDVEDQVEGTWVVSGGTLLLTLDTGGTYPLQVRGDTITQVIDQFTLRYVR